MTGEQEVPSRQPVESLDERVEHSSSPSIFVNPEVIAADAWESLVAATQSDGIERGLVIAKRRDKIIRSKEIEGLGEQPSDEDPSKTIPASFPLPALPFGVKSLLPTIKELVVIHTHPMPPDLDHLRTTPISDRDIRAFTRTRYVAMVMLDRGGAHLLARTSSFFPDDERLLTSDIVDTATKEVIAESGGSMDVMTKVARRIANYGLGYFYTPDLSQQGAGVEFRNLRFEEDKPAAEDPTSSHTFAA